MDKFKCDVCGGRGGWSVTYCYNFNGSIRYRDTKRPCPKCKGFGELDWIQNACGGVSGKTFIFPSAYVFEGKVCKLTAWFFKTKARV